MSCLSLVDDRMVGIEKVFADKIEDTEVEFGE